MMNRKKILTLIKNMRIQRDYCRRESDRLELRTSKAFYRGIALGYHQASHRIWLTYKLKL